MNLRDPFKRTSELCLDGRIARPSAHPVAAGGYADVWEGYFETRKVAIKVMRPFASSGRQMQQSKLLRRLWREYLAWSCLSHPNILECLGFSYDFSPDSYLFPSLISPWLENGTVISYLERYPETDRLRLLMGVAEGLSYLHARKPAIVHGDLRAGNILVSELGVPCLSDFGLSRVLSEARGITTSTDLAGSLRWMSPELFQVDQGVSVHSDIWAYGMTVLEIVTGERPYSNVKSDIFVLGQIRDGLLPLRPRDTKNMEVPSDKIWNICQRCWSLQPSHRPSMREVTSMFTVPDQPLSHSNVDTDTKTENTILENAIEGIHDPEWWKYFMYLGSWPEAPSPTAFPSPSVAPSPLPSVFPPPSPSLFPSPASSTSSYTPSSSSQSSAGDSQGVSTVLSSEFQKDGSDWFARISNVSPRKLAVDVNLAHTLEHESVVRSVRFSPDGKYLATGCNRTVQIYDTRTGAKLCVLKDETMSKAGNLYIRTLCFTPNGKYIATGADDKQIRIWNIGERRIRTVYKGHQQEVYSLEFSRDGRLLVSCSGSKSGHIWDIVTGEQTSLLIDEPSLNAGMFSVAISPDGRHVATGSMDDIVRLWDVETGALIERLVGHKGGVHDVAFTPDGRGLVSSSADRSLKHWDLGPLLKHPMRDAWLSQPYKPSRPPKQSEKGCECTQTFTGHRDSVLSAAVSKDSEWVVSSSRDGCVQFWDIHTAQSQLMLQGHKGPVTAIDLSPSGRVLVTGSEDGRARIWSLEELDCITQGGWENCVPLDECSDKFLDD